MELALAIGELSSYRAKVELALAIGAELSSYSSYRAKVELALAIGELSSYREWS